MPTVREDVAFGPAAAGLKGAELESRVDGALERVGMADFKDRPPHNVTVLVVTYDLSYALELCPRSLVLGEGVIAADGKTAELLADDALMRAHCLKLPFGFDPRSVPPDTSRP